ncbi:hypothetical protein G4B88_000505 [Cannabis sativa]|uniref:Uncharacterized protein n=1 Tax=Cannabis sativa TaxID=3483 RepID=A0A7J6EMR3_CANSA|nr:hypothetical protein G4B88_000505 [Cannabis sativa]
MCDIIHHHNKCSKWRSETSSGGGNEHRKCSCGEQYCSCNPCTCSGSSARAGAAAGLVKPRCTCLTCAS